MKKILWIIFISIISFPSFAEGVKLGKTYDNWSTFYYNDKTDGKVCYIAASPEKSVGNIKGRKDSFAIVTHRSKSKIFDIFNLDAGYTYQSDSPIILEIKEQKFNLTADSNSAWAGDGDDLKIIQALSKAAKMTVKGKSKSGVEITDTFSLKGFARAYTEINKECKQ